MEKMKRKAVIKSVVSGSIADEIELEKGDCILKINDTPICDVLDYKFMTADEFYVLEILKKNGEIEIVEVESDYEDLGVEFENSLMDEPMHCKNKCIFCFIDQLPKGMRETLYFKDDDARLSFLQGNYITLTNLSEEDIERIIRLRITPVNVSVHTTDSDLRCFMLKNKFAGKLYEIMKKLAENKIKMNCQIVLCKNVNDREKLKKTVFDLAALYPYVNSVSVVPVGLSAHREGLFELEAYDEKSALLVISQVEAWQKEFLTKYNSRIVYLADEFYIMAKKPLPKAEEYEGFVQIENGVGLISSLESEFEAALRLVEKYDRKRSVTIVTGELAGEFISSLTDRLTEKFPSFSAKVLKIKNNFFGGGVNVSGLVCACDIIEQTKGESFGEGIFISASMLRDGDDVFLDNMRLTELEKTLNTRIKTVENDGFDFIEKLLDIQI